MALSDAPKGRFSGLKRAGERIESQSITPHLEAPESKPQQIDTGSLKDRLGGEKPARSATVRMSVEMPQEMHQQVTSIASRTGLPKAEVVRQILSDVLPDLV